MFRAETQPSSSQSGAPISDLLLEDIHWGTHHEWHWNGYCCHWRHLGEPQHPPLVLIHGFATGCGHWRRNAGALAAAGWSVYGLDLVGFGASSQPGTSRLDNRLWARQLEAFLQGVVQRPAVLVGHSLGGLVALSCSVFFPKLVVAIIAAPLPDPTLLMVMPEEANRSKPRRRWRRITKRWVIEVLCRILPLEIVVPILAHSPLLDLAIQTAYLGPVIGDGALHHVISRPARRPGAVRALRAMSIGMALRPTKATAPSLLKRVSHPMLLVWGEQDVLVPLQVGWQCQRFRNDLPVTVIPGAGHCPHDEKAAEFNGVVIGWLMNLSIHPHSSLSEHKRASEHVP